MLEFWKNAMEHLLGTILYHGEALPGETWVNQYQYEVRAMVDDIKEFHFSLKNAGLEVSNEAMAAFLVYAEHSHIGNDYIIERGEIDREQLIFLAAAINDELN